jgi:hypothetical protein
MGIEVKLAKFDGCVAIGREIIFAPIDLLRQSVAFSGIGLAGKVAVEGGDGVV